MSAGLEISLIAALISAACALPGAFLVFRRMSMMTDAITHSILLGIVLAFFRTRDLTSPWLIVGATLMGVFTVWLTETLTLFGCGYPEFSDYTEFPEDFDPEDPRFYDCEGAQEVVITLP